MIRFVVQVLRCVLNVFSYYHTQSLLVRDPWTMKHPRPWLLVTHLHLITYIVKHLPIKPKNTRTPITAATYWNSFLVWMSLVRIIPSNPAILNPYFQPKHRLNLYNCYWRIILKFLCNHSWHLKIYISPIWSTLEIYSKVLNQNQTL